MDDLVHDVVSILADFHRVSIEFSDVGFKMFDRNHNVNGVQSFVLGQQFEIVYREATKVDFNFQQIVESLQDESLRLDIVNLLGQKHIAKDCQHACYFMSVEAIR